MTLTPQQEEATRQSKWMLDNFPSLEILQSDIAHALSVIRRGRNGNESLFKSELFGSFPLGSRSKPGSSAAARRVYVHLERERDLRMTRLTDSSVSFEGTEFVRQWMAANPAKNRAEPRRKRVSTTARLPSAVRARTAGVVKSAVNSLRPRFSKKGVGHKRSAVNSLRLRFSKKGVDHKKEARKVSRPAAPPKADLVAVPGAPNIFVPARGSLDTTIDSTLASTASNIAWEPYKPDFTPSVMVTVPGVEEPEDPFYTIAGLWEGKTFTLETIAEDQRAASQILAAEEKMRWKAQRLGLAQCICYCIINKQLGGLGLGMVGVAESFTRVLAISDTVVLVEVPPAIADQFAEVDCNVTELFPEKIREPLLAHSFLACTDWNRFDDLQPSDIDLDAVEKFRDFWIRCLELVPDVVGPEGPCSFCVHVDSPMMESDTIPVEPSESRPRKVSVSDDDDELGPEDSHSVRGKLDGGEAAYEALAASKHLLRAVNSGYDGRGCAPPAVLPWSL